MTPAVRRTGAPLRIGDFGWRRAPKPLESGVVEAVRARFEQTRFMAIRFNHTILPASDPEASARFTAELLGLSPPRRFSWFWVVDLADEASIDYAQSRGDAAPHHVAFLVSDAEFDEIYRRIQAKSIPHWADPGRTLPDQINHHHGGRGVYFADSAGHYLECITRPYGNE